MDLPALLSRMVEAGASDLHLSAGQPPLARVDGQLQRWSDDTGGLSVAQTQRLVDRLRPQGGLPHAAPPAEGAASERDHALDWPGLGRFRVHTYVQHRGPAVALRAIPSRVCSLAELNAPEVLAQWALRPRGLVLVTGATGSGKSTTLAALLDHRNRLTAGHLLTIEDPIEYLHDSQGCLVTQREVGTHTASFADAIKAALREDPDVILIGELRDLASIRLALTAAETGHLVLATLHAAGAAAAVDRLVDVFPGSEKDLVRAQLAESLVGVVSQVLCRRADGPGRVAALEILAGNPAARHLIREHKVAQLHSVMQSGQSLGMQTLDQHLGHLLRQGRITAHEARAHARHPETFP